ncbi:ribosome small subunit-dependent GTPase A [Oceaniglobus ichthyenteri]|uniref:ribosome small subunit-dependent GTPase A n=1 Tax=Oceaniglobus ichthyenteri TaxID=2136177 RepID=UPI001F0CAA2C|nr:ribosome small subunit-dependent GTPase A [Oceaniglobus ichthyenteri]
MADTSYSLADLGWSDTFSSQLGEEEDAGLVAMRVTSVMRDSVLALGESGTEVLVLPGGESAGDYAVGDWVLATPDIWRVARRLERHSLLQRRAAGTGRTVQLIAANIDTLFIVSSCNADFNPARLERYLILAAEAGVTPVILLTKADMANADDYVARARALGDMPVEALNARDPGAVSILTRWLGTGRTGALLGSSGVGKTTLLNALTNQSGATDGIREDDAKGRHTTTARGLFPAKGGSWLVDTPGMRAIRLSDVSDGIDVVFGDLVELAGHCKFNDCAHQTEPGCAIQAAIATGAIDADRLERWRKLAKEEEQNTTSIHESRRRDRSLQKTYREGKARRQRKQQD